MPHVPTFTFPSLYEFVEDTRKKLQEPLALPAYAAANEAVLVQKVSEIIAKDPYRLRISLADEAVEREAYFQPNTLRAIRFHEYPGLYRAAQFTTMTAKQFADMDVMIQIYRAKSAEDVYQAKASSYLNKAWLYISEHFFMQPNAGMLRDEEVCFMLGHELGHAQCRHRSISLLTGEWLGSNAEYSADRGGLIICAQWLLRQQPEGQVKDILHRAVLGCVATLDKLGLAYSGFFKWQEYDYDELGKRLQSWLDAPGKLPPDSVTHPCDARRALALYHFSQSELLYRCLGLEPEPGLLTDRHLREFMNTLLKS